MAASLYLCGAVTFLNWDTVGRLVRPASHLSDFKSVWLIVHVRLHGMPLKSSGSRWGSVKDGLKLILQTINHCGSAASVAASSSRARRMDTKELWVYITQVYHASPEPTTEQLRSAGFHLLPLQTGEDLRRLGRL